MRTTDRLRPALYAILGILVLYVVHCQGERSGAQREKLRAESAVTDASRDTTNMRLAELAAREIARESTLARTDQRLRDARGEIARLKQRVAPPADSGDVVRDSIITNLETALTSSDSAKSIWKALAQERGILLARAVRERESYKAIGESIRRQIPPSSQMWTDIGGGLLLGVGLAKDNETVAASGAALIVVPRLLRGVLHIF